MYGGQACVQYECTINMDITNTFDYPVRAALSIRDMPFSVDMKLLTNTSENRKHINVLFVLDAGKTLKSKAMHNQ